MNPVKHTFLIVFMLSIITAVAQKEQHSSLSWKIGGVLPKALAGTVAGISNDVLIVAGGNNFPDSMPWLNGRKKYYDDLYVFSWEKNKIVLNRKRYKLSSAVAYAAVCSTTLGVLYAGGENADGICNKTMLLVWDAAAENMVCKPLPDLPTSISNAAAAVNDHIVYIAGGETTSGVSDHFYCLDLDNTAAGWKQLPAVPNPLSHAVAVVQSNGLHICLYLLGGRKKNASGISDLYATVFAFDLIKGQWEQKKSLPFHLSAGPGIAAGKQSIVLFGGDRGNTFHATEKLIAAIAAEKDPAKKNQLKKEKIKLQSSHPGSSKEILAYNTLNDNWDITGTIPYNAPVTVNAAWWRNTIVIAGGEIKAGVRSSDILMGSFKQ